MAFWIVLLLLTLAMAIVWWRHGPRHAVIAGVLLSLLAPEWLKLEFSSTIWINIRLAAMLAALSLYLLHPRSTYNFKLVWADYAMLGLLATHVLSDTLNSGFHWSILLRAYGEWAVPYLAGRVAIQYAGDAKWSVPWAVTVAFVLAGLALAESALRLSPNIPEFIVGLRTGFVRDLAQKAGFKRAYGTTMEPLFFAMLQFLLLPWLLYATVRTARGDGPLVWGASPIANFVGILATLSRGPLIAMAVVGYVMQMILYPRRRVVLGIAGACMALVLVVAWPKVLNTIEALGGESQQRMKQAIGGDVHRATSVYNRLNLFSMYEPALRSTGLFGYGTAKCTQFPPLVPRAEADPGLAQFVDNAFLLYTLRFGYLGLLFFTAANVASAYQFVRLALRPQAGAVVWCAAMAGTIAATMLLLCTVFLAPDFGLFYIFMLGTSSGMWAEHRKAVDGRGRMSNERNDR
jgi:hypothetical protein